MNISRPVRRFLARRPWVYWVLVAALAGGVGVAVRVQLQALDEARRQWADTATVWVADHDIEPGDSIQARRRQLPLVAVPADAVIDLAAGTVARQRIATGEAIVEVDVAVGRGPAAAAVDGEVVVPISDPLLATAPVGADVAVYADGLVLAADGHVVHVDDAVVFVAVAAGDGPLVAAAAQLRTASIVFTR
jgi:hypothetical protein